MNILSYFPENYIGSCLEVGACDGIFLSNTLELEQLGWKCLCIEPNPYYYNKLINNRKICQNYAVSSENKDNQDFHIFWNNICKEAGISSLIPDEKLIKHFSTNFNPIRNIKVDVRTLDFCLKQADFIDLDFLSLDIEGGELSALK